jgi:hypothetical protein
MKDYESGILGAFIGGLILCTFMAFFREPSQCTVSMQRGQETVVYIGKTYDTNVSSVE